MLEQFLGFFIGMISSWLFLFWLLFLRPNLQISDVVVYDQNRNKLRFKLKNGGLNQIVDIEFRLSIIERYYNDKAYKTRSLRRLLPNTETFMALAPRNSKKAWGIITAGVFTVGDADEIIKLLKTYEVGERRIVLTIKSTHSLSSTTTVSRVTYTADQIKLGRFGKGLQFIPD